MYLGHDSTPWLENVRVADLCVGFLFDFVISFGVVFVVDFAFDFFFVSGMIIAKYNNFLGLKRSISVAS